MKDFAHFEANWLCSLWSKFFPLKEDPLLGSICPTGKKTGKQESWYIDIYQLSNNMMSFSYLPVTSHSYQSHVVTFGNQDLQTGQNRCQPCWKHKWSFCICKKIASIEDTSMDMTSLTLLHSERPELYGHPFIRPIKASLWATSSGFILYANLTIFGPLVIKRIVNGVPLHTAFNYHLPIVLIWLKYCWKGGKIASHPSIHQKRTSDSILLTYISWFLSHPQHPLC